MVAGPLVAVAGIALGVKVVSCIFDELTEQENRKQAQLRKERDEVISALKKAEKEIEEWRQQNKEIIHSETLEKEKEIRRKSEESIREKRSTLLALLRDSAENQKKQKVDLCDEIETTIRLVRDVLKQQNSMLRRNSLRCLLRELEESKEKNNAYIIYIGKYLNSIQNMESNSEITDIPKVFSFVIPKDLLYKGKLIFINKRDLLSDGVITVPLAENQVAEQEWWKEYRQKYHLCDQSFIEEMDDNALIPVMCDYFVRSPNFHYQLSAKKGFFKNIVANTPKLGITAIVTGYDKNHHIDLEYAECIQMKLRKNYLLDEKHYPPIGAELRVFPIDWQYLLRQPIEVSERISDSYLGYTFDELPIVLSDDQWVEFKSILDRKELLESTGDWKIAPLDESKITSIKEVKLQLDTSICFAATVVEDNGYSYFSFNGFLSKEAFLKPEDVFLGIDCTLGVYLDSDMRSVDKCARERMSDLLLLCMAEFKVQYITKISRKGMQYFNKWAETTDKLINYLQKGDAINIEIASWQKGCSNYSERSEYEILVKEPELLKMQVDDMFESKGKQTRYIEFFLEPDNGYYCMVSIKADGSSVYLSGENRRIEPYLSNHQVITLYQRNYPYAEIQQAMALQRFRVGRLSNSLLQAYALNASNIKSSKEAVGELSLNNEYIGRDSSQVTAVLGAITEKDIFLIQGPPGTGKTTVIREVILQILHTNPLAKILVVSQANVAVDNVLKGLIGKMGGEISFVRCGHRDRIDSKIEPYSFEHIYQQYLELMREKKKREPDNRLLEEWSSLIFEEGGYNPNVGELILKNCSIIGATCVGLAQKRIGLSRVEYDLVIIDEAGKALPAEILIPYIRGKKVLMIGDHMQLPPTVHPALLDDGKIEIEDREIYEDELFGTSFFQRLYEAAPDTNKCMLTTQYRMPSKIGTLISSLFYGERLHNGQGTELKKPLFFDENCVLIDMLGNQYHEKDGLGQSVTNPEEARLVIDLLLKIREKVLPEDARIAVITPYRGQKRLILKRILEAGLIKGIDVNTVDAFQGDEAEIVVFCCTRTKKHTNFFKDPRRINVAFSRAKNELIILGSMRYLKEFGEDSVLPKLARYIQENGKIISANEISNYPDNYHVVINVNQIWVNPAFCSTPPKEEKVQMVKKYYYRHGKLDKPIIVRRWDNQFVLKDKYLRYYVAQQLGLETIEAIIER